jgi:hypothetical protein
VAIWPRLLLGEDWASGEPKVCPLPEGSGEARSCPLSGPSLDLIAPIRPLQLCANGGLPAEIRSLRGTPNYGPRQISI